MGISSPDSGYKGLVASATTLQKDTTEYSTTETSPITKITGSWIEDTTPGSTLRFIVDLKKAGAGSSRCRLYIDGVAKGASYLSESGAGYATHSEDIEIDWKRGSLLEIKLWSSVAGTAYMDNAEIAGDQSPVIFD